MGYRGGSLNRMFSTDTLYGSWSSLSLLAMALPQMRAGIALAKIVKQGDDVARPHRLGDRIDPLHIGAGGLTDKKTGSGKAPAHVVRRLHGHVDAIINDALVKNSRDNRIRTAQRLEPLHTRKLFGDDGNHLNIGIVLLEAPANARDGATGADPTDKMRHFPLCLLQDLHRRAVIVGLPIAGIAVLIGKKIALRLPLGQAMHLAQRLVIALQCIRRDELGAVRDNALAPFKAGILRYYEMHRVL